MKSKIPGMSLDLKVPLPSCGYTRTGIQGNNRWRGAVTSTSSINDATVLGTYSCQEWDHIESLDTCTGWSVERSKTKCEMWGAATLVLIVYLLGCCTPGRLNSVGTFTMPRAT